MIQDSSEQTSQGSLVTKNSIPTNEVLIQPPQSLTEENIAAFLSEIDLQAAHAVKSKNPAVLQATVKEAKQKGVPEDRIKDVLKKCGIPVASESDELLKRLTSRDFNNLSTRYNELLPKLRAGGEKYKLLINWLYGQNLPIGKLLAQPHFKTVTPDYVAAYIKVRDALDMVEKLM